LEILNLLNGVNKKLCKAMWDKSSAFQQVTTNNIIVHENHTQRNYYY
jgi:hypothetical protein